MLLVQLETLAYIQVCTKSSSSKLAVEADDMLNLTALKSSEVLSFLSHGDSLHVVRRRDRQNFPLHLVFRCSTLGKPAPDEIHFNPLINFPLIQSAIAYFKEYSVEVFPRVTDEHQQSVNVIRVSFSWNLFYYVRCRERAQLDLAIVHE